VTAEETELMRDAGDERPQAGGADLAPQQSFIRRQSHSTVKPPTAEERARARAELDKAIQVVKDASVAPNTRRAYESDLRQFQKWRAGFLDHEKVDWGVVAKEPTPPASVQEVIDYLFYKSTVLRKDGSPRYSPASMGRWIAALNWVHAQNNQPQPGLAPEVKQMIAGLRRLNRRPPRRADPLMLDGLRSMLLSLDLKRYPGGVKATRDAAVVLFAFVGAMRRSEVGELRLRNVKRHPADGLHLRIESSKTDQAGRGAVLALPYGANSVTCAPCAFARWYRVRAAAIEGRSALMATLRLQNVAIHICQEELAFTLPTGVRVDAVIPSHEPLFPAMARGGIIQDRAMSGAAVSDLIKLRGKQAGLDTTFLSGHSPRSGFVTEGFRAGATSQEIMRQGRWTSVAMLEVYQRESNPLAGNAISKIAL